MPTLDARRLRTRARSVHLLPRRRAARAAVHWVGFQQQTEGIGSVQANGLDVGAATDVGRVRESNEDALLAVRDGDGGAVLIAVADGMGGHNAGEVASALAVESLARLFEESDQPPQVADDGEARLGRAVQQANRAIWEAACADAEKEGMGTTLVCALVAGTGEVMIANVGDSRAYVVKGGEARLLTIDHTWVTDQVRTGQMSERDARVSPYRHLLTRSLGATPMVQVDLFSGLRLEPGDVSRELEQAATAQQAAERLVSLAVERGGADNATAVVVRRV